MKMECCLCMTASIFLLDDFLCTIRIMRKFLDNVNRSENKVDIAIIYLSTAKTHHVIIAILIWVGENMKIYWTEFKL